MELIQMDVKIAFLHGDLEEDGYMVHPKGFEIKLEKPTRVELVCRLQNALYGRSRQWCQKFDKYMQSQVYVRSQEDHCLYNQKLSNGSFIILILYVDDMLIAEKFIIEIKNLKESLSKQFYMKDLGDANHFLDMRIKRDRQYGMLELSQEKYVHKPRSTRPQSRKSSPFQLYSSSPISTVSYLFLSLFSGGLDPGDRFGCLKEGYERMQFFSTVAPADYEKRNYAKDVSQYTDVLYTLNDANRPFLLRDVYDDMILDGIQPKSDTFVPLLVGCLKGSRLQDAFYFYDEMKLMGYVPDDLAFNCLVATCGRCRQQRRAFQVVEEMKDFNMRPKMKTLTALLGACGSAGMPKEAAGVVQRITESGLTLNQFCYAALIAAEKNQLVKRGDPFEKIMEILNQARSWLDMSRGVRDRPDIVDEIDEYIYCLPTVDFVRGRGNLVDRKLTVYHAALSACADLKSTAVSDCRFCVLIILKKKMLDLPFASFYFAPALFFFQECNLLELIVSTA
ncbi:hypothetical protein L7F22_029473 [Adiantum nelumboides]|nr:hypothetical protein [Adiantum nelumboides]